MTHAAIAKIDEIDAAIDLWWGRWFRNRPVFDRLFYFASESANFSILWYVLVLVQSIKRRNLKPALESGVVLALESAIVNGVIKSLFMRSRPKPKTKTSCEYTVRQPLTSSFPSGHASAAILAATMMSRKSRWNPLWYIVAVVVALSRVHTQTHHASDVAAGLALGAIFGTIVQRVLRKSLS